MAKFKKPALTDEAIDIVIDQLVGVSLVSLGIDLLKLNQINVDNLLNDIDNGENLFRPQNMFLSKGLKFNSSSDVCEDSDSDTDIRKNKVRGEISSKIPGMNFFNKAKDKIANTTKIAKDKFANITVVIKNGFKNIRKPSASLVADAFFVNLAVARSGIGCIGFSTLSWGHELNKRIEKKEIITLEVSEKIIVAPVMNIVFPIAALMEVNQNSNDPEKIKRAHSLYLEFIVITHVLGAAVLVGQSTPVRRFCKQALAKVTGITGESVDDFFKEGSFTENVKSTVKSLGTKSVLVGYCNKVRDQFIDYELVYKSFVENLENHLIQKTGIPILVNTTLQNLSEETVDVIKMLPKIAERLSEVESKKHKRNFKIYKSNSSVGEFNDDIAGCMDFTVFHLQIQEKVEDPQFEKVFGLHHTSLEFGNETIPWYTPVVCCYDLRSKMMLAFSIPDLKYLTSYALDEIQAKIFERYQVVTPRAVEFRTFDRLLNLVKEDREEALNLLPQTYRNSVLHIFLQQQEE